MERTVQGSSYVSELGDLSKSSAACGLIGWEGPRGQTHRLADSHMQTGLGSVHPLQLLKMFPSITDIDESSCRGWRNEKIGLIALIGFLQSPLAEQTRCLLHLRMEGSDMITMTYVLEVKTSMKAAKLEFLTSMLWKEAASLLECKSIILKIQNIIKIQQRAF